ncbi:PQQ-binding-like beta-propeller repeat protein [Streptomyces sp. NPDC050704]|uniref:outer membrane protein assembly factor BamB family protein n=1 Tax=Streptomyces sp. NPDC050704 TaxID=3157219 RepID=UPI0034425958
MRTKTEAGGLLMRRPVAHVAGVLALFGLAACTGANGEGRAAEDGKPPSSVRADAFEAVWSQSVLGEPGTPTATDDVVLIPHGHMIDVRDARTGKSRRTVRADPAEQIVSTSLTGDVIVAGVERNSFLTLQGFDVHTGMRLWTHPYKTRAIVRPRDEQNLVVPGTVIVTERGIVNHVHGGHIIGLNVRTGEPTWQQQAECDSKAYTAAGVTDDSFYSAWSAATARYLITLCEEDSKNVLKALDPRDGHRVWQADVKDGGTKLSTTTDVIGVQSIDANSRNASFTLFDESGDHLADRTVKDQAGESRTVGRVGDTVYFHDGRQLHALRADGSPLWRQDAPDDLVVNAQAVISNGETLTPQSMQRTGVSVVIDLSGKRRAMLPWPLRGELIGMSGELLIIRGDEEDGARYTALRLTQQDLEEPALGGVAPSDWPDACSLLSDKQLNGLGEGYLRLPVDKSRTVFGVRLPHQTQCRFATESGSDKDIFQITVRWVATDSDTAREVFASGLPWDTGVKPLNRSVHLISERTGLLLEKSAVVASGRYVIGVNAPKNEKLVRTIALLLSD